MIRNLFNKLPSFSLQFSFATPPEDRILPWQTILLAIVAFFACYYGFASYAIVDMNEGLYAEVAREMVANHHWIIPHLNGVPYLDYPPLLYWLIALSYHIFGVNAFAARLVPCTMTLLTGLSLFYFGQKLRTPRVGWIAAMVLLTSLVFVIIGRVVFFDMLLTFCLSSTLLTFYLWHQERKHSYLYASYFFLALAILTKGVMALVLTVPVIAIFLWLVKEDKSIYRALFDRKAIILFLVVVLPWHILAIFSQWGFFYEYFINNQLLRFFNARVPHDYHSGPIYYYLPRVIAYLLPWSLGILCLFPWPIKLRRPFAPLPTFLWTWILFLLVFFSISGDKGEYYMVLAMPAFAYLLAMKINQWMAEDKAKWLMIGFTLFVTLLLAAGVFALLFYQTTRESFANNTAGDKIPYALNGPLFILFVFLLAYGAVGLYLYIKNRAKPLLPFLLLAGLIVPTLLFYLTVKNHTQITYSEKNFASYVRAQYEYRPTYLYQNFAAFSSYVFYNGETSMVIDNQSPDLYYGSTTSAGKKQFISLPQFIDIAKQRSVYVVIRANAFAAFKKAIGENNNFCVVQSNGRVSLLSNAIEDCKASIDPSQGQQKLLDIPGLPAPAAPVAAPASVTPAPAAPHP